MRTLDFSPLFRSTVGFDQFADMFNRVLSNEIETPSYPPFNIEKTDENAYRISVAVAGFAEDELNVEVRENQLVIAARKASDAAEVKYLHRGIAQRAFEKRFQLADHVVVTGAVHENGMLHIDLAREIPEALKPRRIQIAGADAIEGTKASKKLTKAA